jgi:hypothetical protein
MRPYKEEWLVWRCPVAACSTASSMVMQWPMATEVTAPTSLTSRRRPMRAQGSRASSLRGFRHPFSRVRCAGRTGEGGIVPRGGC